MRFGLAVLALLLMSGCTALVVGGQSTGGYTPVDDSRDSATVASDSAISAKINGRFGADPVVSQFGIDVGTYQGTVTLSGSVDNYVARDQAGRIANDTAGVVIVNNQIVVVE